MAEHNTRSKTTDRLEEAITRLANTNKACAIIVTTSADPTIVVALASFC